MTITEFLLARIAEDEAVARKAAWTARGGEMDTSWAAGPCVEAEEAGLVNFRRITFAAGVGLAEPVMVRVSDHIVRHDPARVLAECEAKRRIVERFAQAERLVTGNAEAYSAAMQSTPLDQGQIAALKTHGWELAGRRDGLRFAVDEIALPYASHPDYDEAWRP